MAKKPLNDCRTCGDFDRVIRSSGVPYQERQNGTSHKVYKFPEHGRSVPIPQHRGDIPTGTRKSIIKSLLIVGLGMFFPVGICMLSYLVTKI